MTTARRAYPEQLPTVLVAVAATCLTVLGAAVAVGSPERALVLLLAALAVVVAASVLANWRMGVYLLLAWLVVEDLPRKFLGNDMRLYFAKDALAAIVYAAFLAARVRGREPRPKVGFWGSLLAFAGWGLVQVFNPASPSLVYGLLGLRMYFFYVPLLFVGYALLRDERDLRRFLAFNLGLATIVAGLGIAQGIVGLNFLNPAELAPELNLAHLVKKVPGTGASVPQLTSVFVSNGRFAEYMFTMFLLGAGSAAYLASRRARGAWMAVAAVGIIAAAVVLGGVRMPFMLMLGSVGVLAGAFVRAVGPQQRRFNRGLALGLLAAGLALVALLTLYPEVAGARWSYYYQTLAPWSPSSDLAWRTWGYPEGNFLKVFAYPGWPLGYGIGTASLGVQYLTGLLGLPSPGIGTENGYGTLILELGVFGLIFWLWWTVALIREGWRIVSRLRGTSLFPVGLTILWFAFLLLFPLTIIGMGDYQNYLSNAYLWLLMGMLARLPEFVSTSRLPPARVRRIAAWRGSPWLLS